MNIAIIAWGSLIWDQKELKIEDKWTCNGPKLPVEFARISKDGRLTLVIKDKIESSKTYTAISSFNKLEDAIENLKLREGTNFNNIGYLTKNGKCHSKFHFIKDDIEKWLNLNPSIDAVIWTDLDSNFKEKSNLDWSTENSIIYLENLKSKSSDSHKKAIEYIKNAPAEIKSSIKNFIA